MVRAFHLVPELARDAREGGHEGAADPEDMNAHGSGGTGQGLPNIWWMTRADSQKNAIEIPIPTVRCTDSAWRRMWPLTNPAPDEEGEPRDGEDHAGRGRGARRLVRLQQRHEGQGEHLEHRPRSREGGIGLEEALDETAHRQEHEGEEAKEHGPRHADRDRGEERVVERGDRDAEPRVGRERDTEQDR